MKFYLTLPAFLLIIIFFESCAPTKATFTSESFGSLRDKNIRTIAVLPFAGLTTDKTDLGRIDTTIINAFSRKKINIKVIGSFTAYNKLSKDLVDQWNNLTIDSAKGNQNAAALTAQIGNDLSADAIIQGKVSNIIQNDAAFGEKFGDTKVTLKIDLLSAKTGKLLWTAASIGTVGTLTTNDTAPPVINAVMVAVKEIFLNFPLK